MNLRKLKETVDALCLSQPADLDTNIISLKVLDSGDWRFVHADVADTRAEADKAFDALARMRQKTFEFAEHKMGRPEVQLELPLEVPGALPVIAPDSLRQ